ncbi:glycosyltransferase family 2 protein [Mycoplasmopsis iners]|uniref:glycosyltransferase family 2 protein n=1 Tax=Mycoplasmopsis iners TaxID=76630 RepID=UPI000498048D|nr:glycosyltransferase [Mycoplasmopsis iners]
MKLSIITPNVNNHKQLDTFLYNLREQNNQDFEIILILDVNNKSIFSVIENHLIFFGSRLKFVLNSKKRSAQSDIVTAFHLVKGDYATILFANSRFKDNFVYEVSSLTNEYNPDILEFLPYFTNSIKWKLKNRIEVGYYNGEYLKTHPQILAYTFPLISNKLYSKKLISRFCKYRPLELNDYKFCLELLYFMILDAKSYQFVNKHLVKEDMTFANNMTLNVYLDEFKKIKDYININNIKLSYEIEYAELYFVQVFLATILRLHKSATMEYFELSQNIVKIKKEKIFEQILKFIQNKQTNHLAFYNTNVYLNQSSLEALLLKDFPKIKTWENISNKI